MLGKIIIDQDIPFYDPNKDNLVDQVSVQGKYYLRQRQIPHPAGGLRHKKQHHPLPA